MLSVTATDLPRLMQCNGSRLMAGQPPAIGVENIVRDEGNAAHWVIKEVFQGQRSLEELTDRKALNQIFVTPEMAEHCEGFLQSIHPCGHVEYETSFKGENWIVNCRADYSGYVAQADTLYVDDFKYGWGIVEPDENWTLIAYAISHCINNNVTPAHIVLTIHQPRPDHPRGRKRSVTLTYEKLLEYYALINVVLSKPSDILNTGKECYKCPAMATCPAARLAQLNAIDASEVAYNAEIDNEHLSFQLDHIARAMTVLKQSQDAYSELAMHRVKQGQIVKNYSVESELSNRAWKKYVTPEIAASMTGKDLSKKQLITPSQAEKAGVLKSVVDSMTERNQKGFKLVRIDENKKAAKMFN